MNVEPILHFSLDGNFREVNGKNNITCEGSHRFCEIGSVTGYQSLSLQTIFRIATDVPLQNEGSIALAIAPLETLDTAVSMYGFSSRDPNAREYGLLADAFPNNNPTTSIFGWYWRSVWHPQMIAKFKDGPAAGAHADYDVTPYVPVEHLPLHEKEWYELVLTWNKDQSRLSIYVNGLLCGTTAYRFKVDLPRPELYLGNTAMVFSQLRFYNVELTATQIRRIWSDSLYPKNPAVEEELAAYHAVQPRPAVDWSPNREWELKTAISLTKSDDFSDWIQQGCLQPGLQLKEYSITEEGLLLETPDKIDVESRVYFWSPKSYEGDIAVEFEFRPESENGLALLIAQASGMQREDFITDHPPRTTGSMGTIIADRVRNYHWEFFRHSVDVRCDLGTQVLVKNPWEFPLALSTRPSFHVNEWYRLLFLQEGDRLRAAINGEWLIDVYDEASRNNGPVYNCGRIGLRLMYQTRMRFRNLKVWNRERVSSSGH